MCSVFNAARTSDLVFIQKGCNLTGAGAINETVGEGKWSNWERKAKLGVMGLQQERAGLPAGLEKHVLTLKQRLNV